MKRALALAAAILVGAAAGGAQTPAPAAPTPRAARTPKAKATAKPPLDFSGVWVLDSEASSGVAPQMQNAVLQVKQNGNRIWIEQIETPQRNILSEQIVVDGKKYEKSLGHGMKGTLEAEWGKDRASLWLQAIAGPEGDPSSAVQRGIWKLQDGGKVWTRQTRTLEPDGARETFLVFRKREASKK